VEEDLQHSILMLYCLSHAVHHAHSKAERP
jgi:hypothetical protein